MLIMAGGSAAPKNEVVLVLSRGTEVYQSVVRALQSDLARQGRTDIHVRVLTLDQWRNQQDEIARQQPSLLVSVGVQAANELAGRRLLAIPVLHTLIPRQAWEAMPKEKKRRDSVIYIDQPMSRKLQLVKLALPGRTRVGVITGPVTGPLGQELIAIGKRQGLRVQVEHITRPDALLPAINRVVEDSQVLFSVADPMVFGPSTIHHILLTTYRHSVPVLGLSRGYVDAGALLAVYSTPEDIGRQLGEVVGRMVKGRVVLPAPEYPRHYRVAVNPRVAASLGLRLGKESVLLLKLQNAEARR